MAQYAGYTCDSCEKVLSPEEKTKRVVKFSGLTEGQFEEDLCSDCVRLVIPEGTIMKPLRRRTTVHVGIEGDLAQLRREADLVIGGSDIGED